MLFWPYDEPPPPPIRRTLYSGRAQRFRVDLPDGRYRFRVVNTMPSWTQRNFLVSGMTWLGDTPRLLDIPLDKGDLVERSFVAEVVASRGEKEIGRDVLAFRREDGVAENFRAEQNRELLEKLSSQTGGRYYEPEQVSTLGEEISYSEAGITLRETKDLWNMPVIFLMLILLKAAEWLLRRKWGVV